MTARRLAMLAALALGLAACGSDGASDAPATSAPAAPPADAIKKTTELGPVKATVSVWPAKPTLGDSIYVRLDIDAPAGFSIDAPFQEAGDQRLGRFRVVGFTRDTTRQTGSGQHHEQTYTLEAQTSGRHRIPPLRLEVLDARTADPAGGKPRAQELLTDEVPLEIAPVDAAAVGATLKPALAELDPEVGGTSGIAILGLVSAIVVLGSGTVLALRGLRARRKREQVRSAYDTAVAQLRELEGRGAPDATAADAWFVELSAIVRRYLEHRYEIRAPELTTEEFLPVATARPELREDHRALLRSFLERCDRVKFAGYRPDSEESLATLAAARAFVEDTRAPEAVAA